MRPFLTKLKVTQEMVAHVARSSVHERLPLFNYSLLRLTLIRWIIPAGGIGVLRCPTQRSRYRVLEYWSIGVCREWATSQGELVSYAVRTTFMTGKRCQRVNGSTLVLALVGGARLGQPGDKASACRENIIRHTHYYASKVDRVSDRHIDVSE